MRHLLITFLKISFFSCGHVDAIDDGWHSKLNEMIILEPHSEVRRLQPLRFRFEMEDELVRVDNLEIT